MGGRHAATKRHFKSLPTGILPSAKFFFCAEPLDSHSVGIIWRRGSLALGSMSQAGPPSPHKAALIILNDATRAEEAGDAPTALSLYESGVQALLASIRCEVDAGVAQSMRSKAAECLERAEALKRRAGPSRSNSTRTLQRRPAPLPPRPAPLPRRGGGGPSASLPGPSAARPVEKGSDEAAAAVEGAILSEKPDVRWDDVAGLAALESATPSYSPASARGDACSVVMTTRVPPTRSTRQAATARDHSPSARSVHTL